MKIFVQTDNFNTLNEAVKTDCDGIRFGPEFCEFKVSSLGILEKAYEVTNAAAKEFTYVTPRLSETAIKKIGPHLDFLNKQGKISVVVNDLGVLSIIEQRSNLKPHFGRQLIYVPARSPWDKVPSGTLEASTKFLERRKNVGLFYQTSLNHEPMLKFLKEHKVKDLDVDWIPDGFQHLGSLVKNGFNLFVILHLVPAAITRRCHTARFLDEESPEKCRRPCDEHSFLLKNTILGIDLFLSGNVVFRLVQPSEKDIDKLRRIGIKELVITTNPITRIDGRERIDEVMKRLKT